MRLLPDISKNARRRLILKVSGEGERQLLGLLRPRLYVATVFDIEPDFLTERGISGLIVDLDNTLVAWNHPDVSTELGLWIADMRSHAIEMCIVSNNMGERVEAFAEKIGVMSIAKAAKPRRRSFHAAMRRMGTHAHTTAVIGDQIFTDILGGNRLNLYTILVHPLDDREYWMTRMVRQVEKALIRGRIPQGYSG